MSRGFVKEDDQEEAAIIPPRAALPPNETNYVTARGMALLMQERENLLKERSENKDQNDTETRRTNTVIDGKLALLEARINSARVLNTEDQPKDEVRFGARVTLKMSNDNSLKTFEIVGVDEASVKDGRIAFVAPIIRALIGKKKGETAKLSINGKEQEMTIMNIEYKN